MSSKKVNYQSYYLESMNKLKEKAKISTRTALESARADFFKDAESRVRTIFNNSIKEFYSDYAPLYYDRNESLYNLIEFKHGADYMEISFIPEKMTSFRSGYNGEDGLYDQVFRKGWHGGAASGPYHPNVGTPYWRKPVPEFYAWGREAEIAEQSPLENIRFGLSDYRQRTMNYDFMRAWNKHKKNIRL